jgi:hypothetical protein
MKNLLMTAVLGGSIVVLGVACGGLAGGTVSCTTGTGSSRGCAEYNFSTGTDQWSAACTQSGGTAGTACTRAGAVGGCRTVAGAFTSTVWFYTGTAADVQTFCTQSGQTFVSP